MATTEQLIDMTTPRQLCEWFAMCARPATTLRAHPIVGDVPICDECAAFCDECDATIERMVDRRARRD